MICRKAAILGFCLLVLAGFLPAEEMPALPVQNAGIDSPIRTIFLVAHPHLDIGYTEPPSAVADLCKPQIDGIIAHTELQPDFVYNIESTWQLQQWMERSTPEEIQKLAGLVRANRIGVGAGHSTLHSEKAGVEEMTRLLRWAQDYRSRHGMPIQTLYHTDNPGMAWIFPHILRKADIRYVVAGQNLFIGGGFEQPYSSYLFRWKGPDGSSVLAWSARNGYYEGQHTYGIPHYRWQVGQKIHPDRVRQALTTLTLQGYPYDAVMVQQSIDNRTPFLMYDAIREWNATYSNPRIVMSRPEDFFEYMEEKYGSQIPERSGHWGSNWDTSQMLDPQAERITRNWRSRALGTQQAAAVVESLGLAPYPHEDFDRGWENILVMQEHSGTGAAEPNRWTAEQTDANCREYWEFATNIRKAFAVHDTRMTTLLAETMRDRRNDLVVVYNPLSWPVTGPVAVDVPQTMVDEIFSLRDVATGEMVSHQRIHQDGVHRVLFIARDIPSMGLKRYRVVPGLPPSGTDLLFGADFLENEFFRIELDTGKGRVNRIYDKQARRELLGAVEARNFNRIIAATNLEYFVGVHQDVPDPQEVVVMAGQRGPVAASLRIAQADHPVAFVEIILQAGMNRIEIVNTVDRSQMAHAAFEDNSIYYGFQFPLALNRFKARYEMAAGWLDPGSSDVMPASFNASHAILNSVNMSEAEYGITFVSPDVWVHSFEDFGTPGSIYPPDRATVVSTFYRKADEIIVRGGQLHRVVVEPGAPEQWSMRYVLRPHRSGFDPLREARTGWEEVQPLQGRFVIAGRPAGPIGNDTVRFFDLQGVDAILTSVKAADFGKGFIVKIQEMAGREGVGVLSSDWFRFFRVTEVTPTEQDVATLYENPRGAASVQFVLNPREIKFLRLEHRLGD